MIKRNASETTSKLISQFTIITASTHKNNLKIGKKISRDESLFLNPKQAKLSKKNLMIKN